MSVVVTWTTVGIDFPMLIEATRGRGRRGESPPLGAGPGRGGVATTLAVVVWGRIE